MQIYKGVAGIQCRVAPATPGDPLALPPPQPGYQSGRGGSVPEGTDPDKIRREQSCRRGLRIRGGSDVWDYCQELMQLKS